MTLITFHKSKNSISTCMERVPVVDLASEWLIVQVDQLTSRLGELGRPLSSPD